MDSNRTTQTNTFEKGLNAGIHKEGLPPSFYTDAINVELSNKDNVLAVQNMRGDEVQAFRLDVGETVLRAFSVIATYGPEKEPRDSLIIFSVKEDPQGNEFRIWIFDCTQPVGQRHLIYDDAQRPIREGLEGLDIQPEMDAYHYGDGPDHYLYWVDNLNPVRYIRMHVEDPSTVDNSIPGLSPLYIANEPDLLLSMRLWPVDMIEVNDVLQSGGGLQAGSYRFAYRYFNTETKQYSVISLLTNPVPVIQDDTSSTQTNDIQGYGPGAFTPKSIELRIEKAHFHNAYYNAIQLYVVRKSGRESVEILELEPSTEYYESPGSVSTIIYSGNERVSTVEREAIQYSDAGIETATTIEEEDGRLFLGSPKLFDVSLPAETPPASGEGRTIAETIVTELDFPVDPLISTIASGKGYYDEMNCHRYLGHFRNEVYQYGKIYFNKFGISSRASHLKFNSLDRYDPGNHSATWQKNHAVTSVFDWKFADRQSQEGALFSQTEDKIRPFGLRITNIKDHPSWAYGMAIVRRKRIENIAGQTPVIPARAVMGIPAPILSSAMENLSSEKPSFQGNVLYDYNGDQDTYWPMRLSNGQLRHLLALPVDSTNPWKIYFKENDPAYDHKTGKGIAEHARVNLFYLYPLEYLANDQSIPVYSFPNNGSEIIKPIDMVLLKSFNFYRDDTYRAAPGASNSEFTSLARDTYGWVFAPYGRKAYYYMNQATPGFLLQVGTDTDGSVPLAPQEMRILSGFNQVAGGSGIPLDEAVGQLKELAHFKWIDNLFGLATQQIADTQADKYQSEDMFGVGASLPQRAMIIIPGMKDSEPATIYDPSEFLLDNYQAGAGDFDAMFGTALDGRPDLFAAGINQGPKDFDVDNTNFHQDFDTRTLENLGFNQVMEPGMGVPLWIANIEKGLSDDRYGQKDTAAEFFFTGAYHKISQAEIQNNTDISMDVWGGDCYITRVSAKVSSNHPTQDLAIAKISDDYQYIDAHGSATASEQARSLHRITAGQLHAEYVDVVVESKVNGHYLYRSPNEYPSGFRTRDAANEDFDTSPDYSYPPGSSIQNSSLAPVYLYNFGYSSINEEQSFFSGDIREVIKQDLKSRISYSNPRVFNSSVLGFDVFSPADFIDLSSQFGRIYRLIKTPDKRLYAIQENGLAQLHLGQTLSEGTSGTVLNISSGRVVGYVRYISGALDSQGIIGIQSGRSAAMTGAGIVLYDWKRNKISLIQGGAIQDIQFPSVEKIINQIKPSSPVFASAFYDPTTGKMGMFEREGSKGIVWNERLGLWETPLQFGVGIQDICVSNGSVYASVDENRGEDTLIYKMYEGSDPSTYLGEPAVSMIEVPLSQGAIETMGRVLYVVAVNSNNMPAGIKARTSDQTSYDESLESGLTLRKSIYYANPFRSSSGNGKRIRSNVVSIILNLASSEEVVVGSTHSTVRTETRFEK